MSRILAGSLVRRCSAQVSCDLGGATAVLETGSGVYYSLEGTAARIWVLLESSVDVETLRARIVAEYDVTADACLPDLIAFLDQLDCCGLLDVVDRGAP
jgi:Coenzyme PQQ synthesis protein D (PqqD)